MIYAITLAIGTWASYDTTAAVQRAAMLGAGLALIPLALALTHLRSLGRDRGPTLEAVIAFLASSMAAAVAVAWFAFPGAINDNVGSSVLVVLFPFTLAAIIRAANPRENVALATHAFLALPTIAALVLMGSHGAWAGLIAAAFVVILLLLLGQHGRRPLVAAALTAVLVLFPIVVLAFAILRPDIAAALGRLSHDAATRPALWRDMLDQLADVPFTGSGLGATMMTDATYVRLTHVGYIAHAHHLYLQLALEQGLPGLATFVGIQAVALYLAIRTGQLPTVAALTALLVHGALDAGLYVARPAPLLFFPAAAAVLLAGLQGTKRLDWSFARPQLLAIIPVALLLLLPASRASLQANLGAVLQSRVELAHYNWPAVPIQDALRRDPAIDLAPAMARFDAALALDPGNATANRRLGQIELSRGQYDAARKHLEAALAAAPERRATRQLLGESYAITGDLERAASLWRAVDLGQQQLMARQFWYEHLGGELLSRRIGQASSLALGTN